MAFDFEQFKSSGNYISAAEKKALADGGIPFSVLKITQKHQFENPQYDLTIRVPNPESGEDEERTLSFPIGSGAESRDAMLTALKAHLDEGGEEVRAKVTKIGRGYYLDAA